MSHRPAISLKEAGLLKPRSNVEVRNDIHVRRVLHQWNGIFHIRADGRTRVVQTVAKNSILEQTMKAQRWNRGIDLLFL